MWIVIYRTYGKWKTTCGFNSEAEANTHVRLYHDTRDYIDCTEVRWIELPTSV